MIKVFKILELCLNFDQQLLTREFVIIFLMPYFAFHSPSSTRYPSFHGGILRCSCRVLIGCQRLIGPSGLRRSWQLTAKTLISTRRSKHLLRDRNHLRHRCPRTQPTTSHRRWSRLTKDKLFTISNDGNFRKVLEENQSRWHQRQHKMKSNSTTIGPVHKLCKCLHQIIANTHNVPSKLEEHRFTIRCTLQNKMVNSAAKSFKRRQKSTEIFQITNVWASQSRVSRLRSSLTVMSMLDWTTRDSVVVLWQAVVPPPTPFPALTSRSSSPPVSLPLFNSEAAMTGDKLAISPRTSHQGQQKINCLKSIVQLQQFPPHSPLEITQ